MTIDKPHVPFPACSKTLIGVSRHVVRYFVIVARYCHCSECLVVRPYYHDYVNGPCGTLSWWNVAPVSKKRIPLMGDGAQVASHITIRL